MYLTKKGLPHANRKHGDSHELLNRVWGGMRERCLSKSHKSFPNYGGRGIKICEEWNDYISFRKWALESGYAKGLTIDRIDVNGNYEPTNCRWATYKEQANNTRSNRLIEFNGIIQTLAQWSEETGISTSTIWGRLNKKWTAEEALTRKVTPNGK